MRADFQLPLIFFPFPQSFTPSGEECEVQEFAQTCSFVREHFSCDASYKNDTEGAWFLLRHGAVITKSDFYIDSARNLLWNRPRC